MVWAFGGAHSRLQTGLEQTNLLEINPDKRSPKMLDNVADHLLRKARGQPPIAAIDCRPLAGERVT